MAIARSQKASTKIVGKRAKKDMSQAKKATIGSKELALKTWRGKYLRKRPVTI